MKMETDHIKTYGTQEEQSSEGMHGRGVSVFEKSVFLHLRKLSGEKQIVKPT